MKLLNHYFLLTICIVSSFFDVTTADLTSPCADWAQYKDEKCFKILDDTFRSYAEAVAACAALAHNPTLPVIHSQEEQSFLSNYLFKTSKKVDNFWLGAMYTNSKFTWLDNSTLTFANWEKTPRNQANHCVQIEADESNQGKWIDEPCEKKNLVVCQKSPSWTLARLQQTLVETRKELHDLLENAQKVILDLKTNFSAEIAAVKSKAIESNANTKKECDSANERLSLTVAAVSESIEAVKKDTANNQETLNETLSSAASELASRLIPINFIYVQLPNENTPSRIWPDMTWYDVSSTYPGMFFRVTGGNAGNFGNVQQDNAPHLSGIQYDNADCNRDNSWNDQVSTVFGGWSKAVVSGRFGNGGTRNCMKYRLTGGEVRPRNMAMKVWKRIA